MENRHDLTNREETMESSASKSTHGCGSNIEDCPWNDVDESQRKDGRSLTNPNTWYTAVTASLPFIGFNQTLMENWMSRISLRVYTFIQFVIPRFPTLDDHPELQQLPKAIRDLWDHVANATTHPHLLTSDFMIRYFDTNQDGTISRTELLNMTEFVHQLMTMIRVPQQQQQQSLQDMSWITWFRREWPLLDWKLGVFIWRSFGGILFVLAVLSIIPGRLHGISGKILRWPILGITYLLIAVELVYDRFCRESLLI
jgi:hypothetical protein